VSMKVKEHVFEICLLLNIRSLIPFEIFCVDIN